MDVNEIMPAGKLTAAQLELLKMFSRDIPDENWKDIKQLIAKYFADKATKEMDKLFEEQGWGEEKLEEWGNEHMRTPYKK